MPLMYAEAFEPLFAEFAGLHMGYVQLDGNVGDRLIADATRHLLHSFGITFSMISPTQIYDKSIPGEVEELIVSGGGNLGTHYKECHRLRRATLECGLPVTILPQSFASRDEDLSGFKRVYVRERDSLAVDASFILMPDLALGFKDVNGVQYPHFDMGVFLRDDWESVFEDRGLSLVDPIINNTDPLEYLEFASRFGHVVTDRLHFAIAAMIVGREATLLPNATNKNRAMYEAWLRDLGCGWRSDVASIEYDKDGVADALWTRLLRTPPDAPPWHTVCVPVEELEPTAGDDGIAFVDQEGQTIARVDENAFAVWSLCDGSRDVASIAGEIAAAYDEPRSRVAADILSTVDALHRSGVVLRRRSGIVVEALPDASRDGWCYRRATVVHPDRPETELWFGVPAEHGSMLSRNADCFVIAMILQAMFHELPLRLVGGVLSTGLTENLARFQEQWDAWRPNLSVVDLEAEEEKTRYAPGSNLISAFSGGLDSCYSLFEHNLGGGTGLRPIDSALMVHGFDIPLTDAPGFAGAFARGERISADAGAVMVPLRTNVRSVVVEGPWEDRHGAALAAALTACSGHAAAGVVASTMNRHFQPVFGSNPVTDPLLGSDRFRILHGGFEATRLEKFEALSQWPVALENLRVCWQNPHTDRNCGRCQKCVIALLSLKCLGLSTVAFGDHPDDGELAALIPDKYPGGLNRHDLLEVAARAAEQNVDTPWARRLKELYLS